MYHIAAKVNTFRVTIYPIRRAAEMNCFGIVYRQVAPTNIYLHPLLVCGESINERLLASKHSTNINLTDTTRQ